MNCKKAQELILTDYFDEQFEAELKNDLEDHISSCFGCREFASVAHKSVVNPFLNAEKILPSDHVWRNIKESIENEPVPAAPKSLEYFFKMLKESFLFTRPAYALACILIIFFTTMLWSRTRMNREIEYIEYLVDVPEVLSNNQNVGYGTAIEDYFL